MDQTTTIALPPEAAERYVDLRLLGAGGMGEVYRAKDLVLDRCVALKVIRKNLKKDRKLKKRFEREVRSLARLSHPNIVSIFDFDDNDDLPFYTMEFVKGQSLSEVIGSSQLDVAQSVTLVACLADALATAHEHGILHRDIKPSNVLISAKGEAKLTDFGLAKFIDANAPTAVTEAGQMLGTLAYLPPEIIGGDDATPASDVYQLGTLLYMLLTGIHPLGTPSIAKLAAGESFRDIEQPSALTPKLDEAIDAIAMRALALDPLARPGAAAFRDELFDWIDTAHEDVKGSRQQTPAKRPRRPQPDSGSTSTLARARLPKRFARRKGSSPRPAARMTSFAPSRRFTARSAALAAAGLTMFAVLAMALFYSRFQAPPQRIARISREEGDYSPPLASPAEPTTGTTTAVPHGVAVKSAPPTRPATSARREAAEKPVVIERRFGFSGAHVTKERPFLVRNEATDQILWRELMVGSANPRGARSGHLLHHPRFTDVSVTARESLRIHDRTDIRQDHGRSVTFELIEPVYDRDARGVELEGSFDMLKGHRNTGCAFASVSLTDGKNTLEIRRGHDRWGKGCDYNASLTVNGKRLYDFPNDRLRQPRGLTTLRYRVLHRDGTLEYWVNGKKVLRESIDFPLNDGVARLRLYGHRWNWKGPIDVRFHEIRMRFF